MVIWSNCLVWILEKKVGQLYEKVGQGLGWEWNNEGGCPLSNWLTRLILRRFWHMWIKNCLNHWKQISKHIFQFLFFLQFFWILDKPFSTSKWFPWIKLFERYRRPVLDLCGLYYACIVVKAKGMKANVDSKNSKDVMVFWNNDLWIMLHHKFICLLCVHHFSFFF